MRKFEMNVPVKTLPDIATAIHTEEFVFVTKPTDDEEIVTIEIPYEKEKDEDISTPYCNFLSFSQTLILSFS